MLIGIISEGAIDQAVIGNILASFGVDSSQLRLLRPDLYKDETDLNTPDNRVSGGWQYVKNDCLSRQPFEDFFDMEGTSFVIVHLDTAEAGHEGYDVEKPTKSKSPDYSNALRFRVIEKINNWLAGYYAENLLYAISVEEMEAWVLTIYEDRDSEQSANPKARLKNVLNRTNIDRKGCGTERQYYKKITEAFRRKKTLLPLLSRNNSLRLFVESLEIALT